MSEMTNTPNEKVRQLQRRLWVCAKSSKKRRFHALYDRIYRRDVQWEAWRRVRSNGGAAGIDRETIQAIEQRGPEEFLSEIEAALRAGRYRPLAVKRRWIPKADGKQRPLGIPTVRDRVVQMAAKSNCLYWLTDGSNMSAHIIGAGDVVVIHGQARREWKHGIPKPKLNEERLFAVSGGLTREIKFACHQIDAVSYTHLRAHETGRN